MILGGAQEDALATVAGLRDTGRYEVGLITGGDLGPEGELLSRARELGVPLMIIPEMRREVRPHSDLMAAAALRRTLSRLGPDIVQTHSSKAGILGRWAARRAGVGAILHRMHGLAFHPYESRARNSLYIAAERSASRWCDRLIVVAEAMKRQALEANVGHERQYVTIPTGVEVGPYLAIDHATRRRVRAELGFEDDDVVMVQIARISPLKGHDLLLDAARVVLARARHAKFLFVGDGPLRQQIERRVSEGLPPGAVRFTGLVRPERIPGLLAASDMLVHASLREGLPRVHVQALLARRPVVAFDVDGTREVVLDGRTGRLVKPRDVAGLASALSELALAPDDRTRMGDAGRKMCRDTYSTEALVRSTANLYDELLASVNRTGGGA
jgi:glycosyltransferase involved in cell wall biosynthesis